MNGDFSRLPVVRKKEFDSVLLQQGRVLLDADWNEQQEINRYRMETETLDVAGRCGVPVEGGGFRIGLLGLKRGVIDGNDLVLVGELGSVLRYSIANERWQPLRETPVKVTLNAVCSMEGRLWAVGDDGVLISTVAGEDAWEESDSGVLESLRGLAVSGKFACAVGAEGTILRTASAGHHWERVESDYWYTLYAVHANVLGWWAVGEAGAIIFGRSDGHAERQLSGITTDLYGVFFLDSGDAGVGWAVGAGGVVLCTVNGGKSWQRIINSPTSRDLFSVRFTDTENGWAVGAEGTVLMTINGGQDWVARTVPSDYPLRDILYDFERSTVYLAGDEFKLFRLGRGCGLYGEYYNDPPKEHLLSLPRFSRIDRGISFDWGVGSPAQGIGTDDFSVRWTGWLKAPATAKYTIDVNSDDGVRLWVGDSELIDGWYPVPQHRVYEGLEFVGGRLYPVRLEYFEAGGLARVQLSWKAGEEGDLEAIPAECMVPHLADGPPGAYTLVAPGLVGEYFNGFAGGKPLAGAPKAVRIDPDLNFAWNGLSPARGIGPQNFSVRWTGWLRAPVGGWTTFKAQGNVRMWLEGIRILDQWPPLPQADIDVKLEEGKLYRVRVEYYTEMKDNVAPPDNVVSLKWRVVALGDTTPVPWTAFFREVGPMWEDVTEKSDMLPLVSSAGRIYVDGILCEAHEGATIDSSGLKVGENLVYLDVWKRHVTSLQDPRIRETALGDVDTATRSQTVWQVRAVPVTRDLGVDDLDLNEWRGITSTRTALMTAFLKKGGSDTACVLSPDASYRGVENQLYRVEIHNNTKGQETYKWSRDNASDTFAIEAIDKDRGRVTLKAECAARLDDLHDDQPADVWLEFTNEENERKGLPGQLCHLLEITPDRTVVVEMSPGALDLCADLSKIPLVRLWNSKEIEVTSNEEPLENGIWIQFGRTGIFKSGDYWLIPARTANGGSIDWPQYNGRPVAQRPHGIDHHYCQLAFLTCTKDKSMEIRDVRTPYQCVGVAAPNTGLSVEAFHVCSTSWGHDSTLSSTAFKEGLTIGFDVMPDPTTLTGSTLLVTVHDGKECFILEGTCAIDMSVRGVLWKPVKDVKIDDGSRVRVLLKGDKILTLPDENGIRRHLDGQALAVPRGPDIGEEAGPLTLRLPSGTGRVASDFESWFFVNDYSLGIKRVNFYALKKTKTLQQLQIGITEKDPAECLSLFYVQEVNSSGSTVAGIAPPVAIEVCFEKPLADVTLKGSIELFEVRDLLKMGEKDEKVPKVMRAFEALAVRVPARGTIHTFEDISGAIIIPKSRISLFFIPLVEGKMVPMVLQQGTYSLVAHAALSADGGFGASGTDFTLRFGVKPSRR
jgi:photosystem II stability/assembly factor-like uncharacterized protein